MFRLRRLLNATSLMIRMVFLLARIRVVLFAINVDFYFINRIIEPASHRIQLLTGYNNFAQRRACFFLIALDMLRNMGGMLKLPWWGRALILTITILSFALWFALSLFGHPGDSRLERICHQGYINQSKYNYPEIIGRSVFLAICLACTALAAISLLWPDLSPLWLSMLGIYTGPATERS
jgi:hypothetical protein